MNQAARDALNAGLDAGMRKYEEPADDPRVRLHTLAYAAVRLSRRTMDDIATSLGVAADTLGHYLGVSPREMPLGSFALMLTDPVVLGPEAHTWLAARVAAVLTTPPGAVPAGRLAAEACEAGGSAGSLLGLVHDITGPDSDGGVAVTDRERVHLLEAVAETVDQVLDLGGVE